MSRAWMPLYVADYLADTGHLSAAEHGAYLLLIMHYWQNGGLPNEDRRLARIARMSPEEWEDSREVLFDLFDDGWTHHRIEAELKAAQDISEKAKEKAAKSWQSRRKAVADAPACAAADAAAHAEAEATALPEQVLETCQSQSQSHTPPDTNVSGGVRAKARPDHLQILDILKTVLTDDRAKAVVEHRRKKRAPLTPHTAGLLAAQFRHIAEPDKAADLMMLRGWQGCEPEWCANAGLKLVSPPSHGGSATAPVFVIEGSPEFIAWQEAEPGKHRALQMKAGVGFYVPTRFPPRSETERAA